MEGEVAVAGGAQHPTTATTDRTASAGRFSFLYSELWLLAIPRSGALCQVMISLSVTSLSAPAPAEV